MKRNILFGALILIFVSAAAYLTMFNKSRDQTNNFGSLLPLSGPVSAYGEMMQKGQLLAIDEIKSRYKDSVSICFYNTEHKKDVALTRLIEAKNKNIKFFVELFGSDQVEHCLDYSCQNDLFILSGVDTKPDLIEKGKGNFARIMPNDADATKEMLQWIKEQKLKNIAILYVNDDWGTGLLNSAHFNLKNSSLNIVGEFDINKNQQSFSSTVALLAEKKPDAICLFIYPDDGGRFIKEAYRQKLNSQFFATENFTGNEMVKTAQKAAIGVKLIVPSTSETNPIYNKMRDQYRAKYQDDPTIFAIKGYDAVLVMYDMITKAKSKKVEDIKNIIINGNYKFEGASGMISFDKNGEFISTKYERLEYVNKENLIQLIPVR